MEPRRLLTTVQEFPAPTLDSKPLGIAVGPDGNLWFTELHANKVGMISPDFPNASFDFATPTADSGPDAIAAGPDGNLWFTEQLANRIGAINPKTHVITEIPVPTADASLQGIAAGSDGRLWFTEFSADKIGAIDPKTHAVSEFAIPTSRVKAGPDAIAAGPDGNLWFTEITANRIGTINPATHAISEFSIPTPGSQPVGIAAGPDGGVWFTEFSAGRLGVINPVSHAIAEIPLGFGSPFGITAGPDGTLWFDDERSGLDGAQEIGDIGTIDPITRNPNLANVPTPYSQPRGIVAGPDGHLWFTEIGGQKISECTPTLVPTFTVPPPALVPAGSSFGVTVTVAYKSIDSADQPGAPDTHFHGLVELSIDPPVYTFGDSDVGGEGSPFVEAHDGVATFSGLMLRPIDSKVRAILVSASLAGHDDSPTTGRFVTVVPPTIVASSPLFADIGRRARLIGFWLEFDTAMDPTRAASLANFSLVQFHRHGRRLVARPVAFRANYDAAIQRVTLTLAGRPKFAQGGELVVHAAAPGGLVDASGFPLDGGGQGVPGDDGTFAIARKCKGISRSAGTPTGKIKGA